MRLSDDKLILLNDLLTPIWNVFGLAAESHDEALNDLTHEVAERITNELAAYEPHVSDDPLQTGDTNTDILNSLNLNAASNYMFENGLDLDEFIDSLEHEDPADYRKYWGWAIPEQYRAALTEKIGRLTPLWQNATATGDTVLGLYQWIVQEDHR